MKTISLLLGVLATTVLLSTGCNKSEKTPPAPEINGVTVDLPKLNEAFANATPEIKTIVTQVGFNIRYTKYEDALMNLDKLANDASLTDAQKKVVTEVIEQAKKLANAAPATAPAQ